MTIFEKTNPKLPPRQRRARRTYEAGKAKVAKVHAAGAARVQRARKASKDWFELQRDTARNPSVRRKARLAARIKGTAFVMASAFLVGIAGGAVLIVLGAVLWAIALVMSGLAMKDELWTLERRKD